MWAGKDLRANNLDVIRFSMAVLVIFSHSYPLLYGIDSQADPLERLSHGGLTFGSLAVDVFFIISGFLITMSCERSSSLRTFLWKRVVRIVPGFIGATLIGAFVIAPWFMHGQPWLTLHFWTSLTKAICLLSPMSLPGVFEHNPYPHALNGSLWTIFYEFLCYLLVMTAAAMGLIRRPRLMLALFVAALLLYNPHVDALWLKTGLHRAPVAAGTWRFGVYFLAGTVFYLFRSKIRFSDQACAGCVGLLPLCLLGHDVINGVLPLALTYITFWLAFQRRVTLHNFARAGDYSYGIYLYAFPIQQVLIASWGRSLTPWTLFFYAASLAIGAGFLSWNLVEKRFLGRQKAHTPNVLREPPLAVVPA